jgi:DNA repair protein RadC
MISAAQLLDPAPPPLRRYELGDPDSDLDAVEPLAGGDLATRSEAELIAQVLAGPEPAIEVLRCGERLARLPFWQRRALGVTGLVTQHAVPPRHAARLAALWELAERWFPDDRPAIGSVRDVLLVLGPLREEATERIDVVMLDSRRRLLAVEPVAVGSVNATRIQPRDVLGPALRREAAAILVAHNHPSGDERPSPADRRFTTALREAAAVVGLPLLDHVILGRHVHYSFRRCEGWDELSGWSFDDDDGF